MAMADYTVRVLRPLFHETTTAPSKQIFGGEA